MTVKITTFEGLRGDLHSDVLSVRNSAIDQAVTMLYESDDMQCGMACAIDELSMSVTRLTSERDAALTRLAELEGLMENAYNRALNQDKRITRLEAEVAALRELLAGNEEVLE